MHADTLNLLSSYSPSPTPTVNRPSTTSRNNRTTASTNSTFFDMVNTTLNDITATNTPNSHNTTRTGREFQESDMSYENLLLLDARYEVTIIEIKRETNSNFRNVRQGLSREQMYKFQVKTVTTETDIDCSVSRCLLLLYHILSK